MFVSLTGVNLLTLRPNRLTGVESCTLLALNDLVLVNLQLGLEQMERPQGTALRKWERRRVLPEEPAVEDLSSQRLLDRVSDFSRVLDDRYAGCFEGLHLLSRRAFAA